MTGAAWWAAAVLGPALALRFVGAPSWLTVGWLFVGVLLFLSFANEWWTVAVTDSDIVVLRNRKMALRREPVELVTRLSFDDWPAEPWTRSRGLALAGKQIDLVLTDRAQVKAADEAIRSRRDGLA